MDDKSNSPEDFVRAMEGKKSRLSYSSPGAEYPARVLGLLSLLGGAYSAYEYIYIPVHDVLVGSALSLPFRFLSHVFAVPLLLLFGSALTIFGNRAVDVIDPTSRSSRLVWIFRAITVALAIVLTVAVSWFIGSRG